MRIEEGGFYAVMGPNGSGKTTLASIMASVRFLSMVKRAIQKEEKIVKRWLMNVSLSPAQFVMNRLLVRTGIALIACLASALCAEST